MEDDSEMMPSLSLYYKGRDLLESGNASEAVTLLLESWSLAQHANTAYQIARAFVATKQMVEAYRWFESAYQANPRSNMIATAYASSLNEQGKSAEAIDVLRNVLDTTPTYGPARKLLTAMQSK